MHPPRLRHKGLRNMWLLILPRPSFAELTHVAQDDGVLAAIGPKRLDKHARWQFKTHWELKGHPSQKQNT